MAHVRHETEAPSRWWWWLLGALVVVGAGIGLMSSRPGPPRPIPVAEPSSEMIPAVPASRILDNPTTWLGGTVAGRARVVEPPTQRGFWIESEDQRLFVVVDPGVGGQFWRLEAGSTVRLWDAVVHNAGNVASVTGQLDPETRRIVASQRMVLVIDPSDIKVLSAPGG